MWSRLINLVTRCAEPGRKPWPADFDRDVIDVIERVRPYTMTGDERLFALVRAVEYTVRQDIPGAIVECGVWRGGSMMAAALTLLRLEAAHRDLWLFDTFQGMTEPGVHDRDHTQATAGRLMAGHDPRAELVRAVCRLDEVQAAFEPIAYPQDKIHMVEGDVLQTIPETAPDAIALLRLDTDWYESTYHELEHLYPRLAVGGILIIDDYGHWQGARKAVDQYIAENHLKLYLARVDYTGRVAVKVDGQE